MLPVSHGRDRKYMHNILKADVPCKQETAKWRIVELGSTKRNWKQDMFLNRQIKEQAHQWHILTQFSISLGEYVNIYL